MAEPAGRERERAPPLLVWVLASFHVALLVAVVVGLLYAAGSLGDQLDALETWIGVVAYLYLWGVTWWTNRRMLDDLEVASLVGTNRVDVLLGAMKWGSAAGLLVFLPLFVLLVVLFVGAGGIGAVPILLLGGAVGVALSLGVGVVVGWALALVDLALAGAVRLWLPEREAEPDPAERATGTDTP